MGTTILNKELIAKNDIVFGMHTFTDSRGSQEAINASHLPFTDTITVAQALTDRYTKSEIAAAYAKLAGDVAQVFSVSTATDDAHAMPRSQIIPLIDVKADTTLVDTKANIADVLLTDGSSPLLNITLASQPVHKQYVDEKIVSIGAGDMAKATYDTNNSGRVDTTEGVGVASEPMGITPYNNIMRLGGTAVSNCDTVDTFGIFVGTDVANAPIGGGIVLEQFLAISSGKVQRLTDSAGVVYNRYYDAGNVLWSMWKAVGVVGDFLPLTGGTVTGQIKGIAPVDDEDLSRKDYVDTEVATAQSTADGAQSTADGAQSTADGAVSVNSTQQTAIDLNTAKVGITTTQRDDIIDNNAKVGVTNEVNSAPTGGGTAIVNMFWLSQSEYDALTPVANTFYVIV